jgi:hypothetical protein
MRACNDISEKEPKPQSRADVHIAPLGLWNGPRVSRSIRIDEKLYQTFKARTKVLGSSVCGVVEPMMAAYLGATESLVNGDVHISPIITIENMEINRQLARDRRRVNPEVAPLDLEQIRAEVLNQERLKVIRKEVREEVRREMTVPVTPVVDDALVKTLTDSWDNPNSLTELNELLNVHNIQGERRRQYRDAVITYRNVHILVRAK